MSGIHCTLRRTKYAALRLAAAIQKLAHLIYAVPTHGQEYTNQWQDYFEKCSRQRVLLDLAQKAKAIGMRLVYSDNTT